MKQAEAELKAQIDALLARAKTTDEAEANEPELDLPAEIERREARLAAIQEARERLEKHQRDADMEHGCQTPAGRWRSFRADRADRCRAGHDESHDQSNRARHAAPTKGRDAVTGNCSHSLGRCSRRRCPS